jgi:arylsulfatase A
MHSLHHHMRCTSRLLLLLAVSVSSLLAAERPNLVVFLADDLGYGDLSCFGSDRVKTPRLDALAAEGARCTQFYGPAAVCSPTRAGMLSGRNPFRLGIYTYIPEGSAMHLQRSERTLPALLRENGYDTCFVGKWAANGSLTDASQPQPSDHGFDHWLAAQNNAVPDQLHPECFVRNGKPAGKIEGYSARIIVDEALHWLEQRPDKARPFCLFVWFHEPHRPIATPPEFVAPYTAFGTERLAQTKSSTQAAPSHAEYLGNIAHMDHQIGRVLDALQSSGDAARTFTLFTSDNGPIEPGSAGPLRAGKGAIWEGGVRMPGILRWPGKVKAGQVIDTPVSGLDLLPTFCEIAGIAKPQDRALDGQSIVPLLEGREFQRTKPLLWWNHSGDSVAIREGDWKLRVSTRERTAEFATRIDWYQRAEINPARAQLFNLREDTAEQNDLAAQKPEVVAQMLPKLTALHRDMQQEQQRTVAWRDEALPRENQGKSTKGKKASATLSAPTSTSKKPNVVLIAVDDLRPQLGAYGVDWMKTPHMDRLAASGTRFDHHYVNIAICIPSRVSLLTSLRSQRTQQVYGPMRWQRVQGAASIGRAFQQAGYHSVSLGKIWHTQNEKHGDSWDEEWKPPHVDYADGNRKTNADGVKGPATEALDVPDETYSDGKIRQRAIQIIKQHAAEKRDQPLFLAVGFLKPHLPFVAPKKYWDLYEPATLPLAPAPDFPKNTPEIARNTRLQKEAYREIVTFDGVKNQHPMEEATQRHLIHGYAACTSYTDEQIGRLLAALKNNGLDENTIVVLWGDHGWHLGDLDQWTKATLFERATRSPLIVRAPGMKPGVCDRLVETVDIFPTLLELCGLPALAVTDGRSFLPLLQDPTQPWKEAVYHCFNRPPAVKGGPPIIGYAVRTEKARYIEWHEGWTLDNEPIAREFYRYSPKMPDELWNLIAKPEAQEDIARHEKLLRRASPISTLNPI